MKWITRGALVTTLTMVMAASSHAFALFPKKKLAADLVEGDISVMVLGSGAAVARPEANGRAQPSYLIFIDGEAKILMDAGSGAYQRIAESGADISNLELVLISHLHADHTGDLTPVIQSVFLQNSDIFSPGQPRQKPVKIFGPASNDAVVPDTDIPLYLSTQEYVDSQWDREQGVDRHVHQLTESLGAGPFNYEAQIINADVSLPAQVIFDENGLKITAVGVIHADIPSLAFSIEYKGTKVTYSGDLQSQTDNITTLANESDLLIFDALVPNNNAGGFHTIPGRTGEIAAAANIQRLLLSHISVFSDGEEQLQIVQDLIREGGYTGAMRPAVDLMVINFNESRRRY